MKNKQKYDLQLICTFQLALVLLACTQAPSVTSGPSIAQCLPFRARSE